MDLLASLDRERMPLFVTLTFPDEFPQDFELFKRHLDTFGQRLLRQWPSASIVWKLEFKERQSGKNRGKVAPHYHLFVYGVPDEFPGREQERPSYSLKRFGSDGAYYWYTRAKSGSGIEVAEGFSLVSRVEDPEATLDCFKDWVSRNWYDVVGSGDVRHFRAGTRVEKPRSIRATFAYAAKKYIAKAEAMPKLAGKPGRFWGAIGRANLPLGRRAKVELPHQQACALRRLIRRYRRAITPASKRKHLRRWQHSGKLYCDVEFWLGRLDFLADKLSGAPPAKPPLRRTFAEWWRWSASDQAAEPPATTSPA